MHLTILNQLNKEGTLKLLVNSGMITTFATDWIKIYNLYTEMVEAGSKKYHATLAVCDIFNISEPTFYKIKKNMEYPSSV